MSEDSAKDREQTAPDPKKREALKKLGRYAAYTAPATLVAVGYTVARGAPGSGVSPPPPSPPPSPPSSPPPSPPPSPPTSPPPSPV